MHRQKAEWKERVRQSRVEDIKDHAKAEHFDGFVQFNYTTLKKAYKKTGGRLIKSEIQYTLETNAPLDFKIGDVVRLFGKEQYTIEHVDITIPEKFQTVIAMNPNIDLKRYQVKVLTLHV